MTDLCVEKNAVYTAQDMPRVLLFVCTGNTCRSPMAAAIFNALAIRRADGRRATSAGLYAREGAPLSAYAAEALGARGIEIPDHFATAVCEEAVKNADLVVGLTSAHAMQLMMRYPAYATKITALPADIDDPFGGDADTYLACADVISAALETAFFGGKV